ncbi:neuropeptide S receptor-like [Mytilus edulis]|uniref:neuropeptide S receptor-like n=1 Tax=Mytilus edulis TaxID=6550 RepID=UPI0039F130C4
MMYNSTGNFSDNSTSEYKGPLLAVHFVLFLLIIIGNLCVLSAIAISGQGRKTRMNFFIMHLAIADLSVGLFYVTAEIGLVASNYEWIAGATFCKLLHYMKELVIFASTYMLVSLSMDRFDAIARPMKFSRKAFRAKLLVCLSWMMAAMFSVPSLVLYDVRQHQEAWNQTMCTIHFQQDWMWKLYFTLIFFACFLIPGIIIAVCYTLIAVIIWKKSKAIEEGSDAMCSLRDGQDYNPSGCGVAGSVIHQAKIRTIKMTFMIVTVFIICWCPYFIISLLQVYQVINNDTIEKKMTIVFFQMFAPLNSAINPIIYGVFSTRICGHLRQVPIINRIIEHLQCCTFYRKRWSYRHSRSGSEYDHSNNGITTKKTDNGVTKSKCITENDTIVTLLRSNSDKSQQHVSFTQPVTNGYPMTQHASANKLKGHRRHSGLPLVKRNITEEENILLRNLTSKLKKRH